jgi:hypothetical protein
MIQTQESIREEEQRQRAQFDRAQMLQNEMEAPPTIFRGMGIFDAVLWDNEGEIYTPELEKITKEFDGHFISNGRLVIGGLE